MVGFLLESRPSHKIHVTTNQNRNKINSYMEAQLLTLEDNIANSNKVKNLIIAKIIEEGYMSEEEGVEFVDRCQVILYKGTWFSKWFQKHAKEKDEKGWYFKIIEMHEKQTSLDDIIRRTAQGK